MAIIKTENLGFVYSDGTPFQKTAISDINIEIEEDTLVGLIGHTGSGKSTLIQHFNGLTKPTSGKIFVDGKDIWAQPKKIRDLRFKVGLVFQYPEYQLFEETVEKDIAFGPKNMGLTDGEIKQRVAEAAEIVGLTKELLAQSPFDLSGGEKRRAALAGVLAMKPKVLVLDEPTAGLDPKGRDMILTRIAEYRKISKTTIVLVSHSMEDIAKVADKVMVMNQGSIAMYDNTETIFARSSELSSMGLNVPQITRVCMGLKARGVDIDPGLFTVAKAKETLLSLLKKGGKTGA